MIETVPVKPLDKALMEEIGMAWHTDRDGSDYIVPELVQVSEDEAEAYYAAANDLYEMYLEAAGQVIDNRLYYELGIPSNLVGLIEQSWKEEHLHLYGRFDLAGGLDGLPIKLIEFNADTPTSLFETSIIQWALLKANGMDETRQFNNLHEMLGENFRRLITGGDEEADFSAAYRGEKLLFSSMHDHPEDERTLRYLQNVAHDAGFYTDFCYLNEAGFLEQEGVFNKDHQRADFWFKLYPWEDIAAEELELTRILERIQDSGVTRFLNPAYTLLFQSKGMLKVLWELFPDSPYLLRAGFEPLPGLAQVEKKLFGREGANTAILDAAGQVIQSTGGPYQHHKSLYQERAALPQDAAGQHYQAGVFHVGEACGLGFRRGGAILDNGSKFVGHRVV
ncbi:MAG: glutathionylspermidine synthase family protein [Gammaproteobacteria bacterium]|nr:glutathionylspermidine synthase family protein [Gammaproteobacteria bacterium]MBU1654787.1 glutathionylspermidine synthase family protein [Gammaproteobacteria bacterium]MBU1961438.1 glutathionylspermidine synthase family protein [Gammaproteobacteria bacterium]